MSATPPVLLPQPTKLQVDGYTVQLRDLGAGGPPILLLHGWGGDLQSWYMLHVMLSARRRTIAVDLPGHGGTLYPMGEGKAPNFAAMLPGVLDGLGIDKAQVVGHSLGGAVALAFAEAAPERFAALTLINAAGLGPEVNLAWIAAWASAMDEKALRPLLEQLAVDKALITPKMLEYALAWRLRPGTAEGLQLVAHHTLEISAQPLVYRHVAETAPFPVQVIWGRRDVVLPLEQATSLRGRVKLHVLDRCGHLPPQEAPQEVAALILNQLA